MKLPIIQSLWIGNSLSKLEQLCIQSFLDNGHEFHLYVYGEVKNIPSGAIVKHAADILPQSTIFRYEGGSLGGFSNWFRYVMLCKNGGFWVDMDVVCLKPFVFDDEFVVGRSIYNATQPSVIGGRHEILNLLADSCRDYPKLQPWDSRKVRRRKIKMRLTFRGREGRSFGSIGGPEELSSIIKHFDLMHLAKPHTCFYPIHYENWDSIFDETFADYLPWGDDTYALHVWNESFRKYGIDKTALFPPNSLFEQLKRKHGI